MTRKRLQALRYSNDDTEAITELVALHLRFHTYQMGWTDSAVRRYVRDAGRSARGAQRADPLRLHDTQRAQGADAREADGRPRGADRGAHRARGARRAATGDRRQPVMSLLGVSPGPVVGKALEPPDGDPARGGPPRRGGGDAIVCSSGGLRSRADRSLRGRQTPTLRARSSRTLGAHGRAIGDRRQLVHHLDVEVGALERHEQLAQRARRFGAVAARRRGLAGVEHRRDRMRQRDDERRVGLEHAVHLAQQPREVVDRRRSCATRRRGRPTPLVAKPRSGSSPTWHSTRTSACSARWRSVVDALRRRVDGDRLGSRAREDDGVRIDRRRRRRDAELDDALAVHVAAQPVLAVVADTRTEPDAAHRSSVTDDG